MSITFLSWESIFGQIGQDLTPHARAARKRRFDLKNAEWHTLENNTFFNGYAYAAGSRYKAFETKNFGWVVFDGEVSRTPDGDVPGRLIHRF